MRGYSNIQIHMKHNLKGRTAASRTATITWGYLGQKTDTTLLVLCLATLPQFDAQGGEHLCAKASGAAFELVHLGP